MTFKIYLRTILYGALFFLLIGLSVWAIGEKATMAAFFALGSAKMIYDARYGYLRTVFPGLQTIDAVAYLLVMALMVGLIVVGKSGWQLLLAAVALCLWGFFCLLR